MEDYNFEKEVGKRVKRQEWLMSLRDGEPCDHPGCLSHISHPCEVCGRIGGGNRMDIKTPEQNQYELLKNERLNTCPFCGHEVEYAKDNISGEFRVECDYCENAVIFNANLSDEDAIERYNKRADNVVSKLDLSAFAKKLHDKSEKYYQEWTFCQDHKFELEAKLKRELSDTIARIVLDLEHEFNIDVQY